ncbi:response regulator [Pseudomonas sp. R5(2019)]|uniref:response regulator n=1 Tax=Pseudomonas sp. R5(2019) TaxID=2697566 RepID=UPI001413776B|nr:response regulator [Pseudomonas sp. R5(2019)]NBA95427.1 response regulator [Pseudomonas sp. R5(2019)]
MQSLKVLILEDHPFQLMALHQMLNANGVFDVLTASSVEAACQSLEKRGPIDIAICDLLMDGLDGAAFIQHLADKQWAQAIIVLSSAERTVLDNVVRLAEHQGLRVLDSVQKPVNIPTLHALLKHYQQACSPRTEDVPVAQAFERKAPSARVNRRKPFNL